MHHGERIALLFMLYRFEGHGDTHTGSISYKSSTNTLELDILYEQSLSDIFVSGSETSYRTL